MTVAYRSGAWAWCQAGGAGRLWSRTGTTEKSMTGAVAASRSSLEVWQSTALSVSQSLLADRPGSCVGEQSLAMPSGHGDAAITHGAAAASSHRLPISTSSVCAVQ